jgi:putative redox protein
MATMILANAIVRGQSGYAQHITTTAGHELASDEPERRGGTNTGAAPYDLMLGSLGACTAITIRMYSDRKQWNLGTINVKLRLIKEGDDPAVIERRISVSEPLEHEQQAKLLEIADKTPVTRALAPGMPIHTTFELAVQPDSTLK